ncbi:MAG TPA: PQQ-dependent sugar dehydrogenase [Candidatus Dormibacteraeota bacterium]|jgi:glucose/arabinose dehydrogenase|nr:PQQ-dependent sugar dehydrogenase [Candidatus Dormibacteraeota bacterium]
MPGPRFSLRSFCIQAAFCGLAVLFCWSCSSGGASTQPPPPPPPPATFELVQVANGFSTPLDVQQPDDNSGRLFVVEQGGHIQIIQSNGTRAASPFLDVTGRSGFTSGGETGLLGLAFHPDYKNNRRFFVNYTRNSGAQLQSVIAEFTASSSNANFTDPTTENILFTLDQPFPNHKGGGLAFGKDGFLYIGFGDGGSAGDPQGNGQNTNTLLGKILRIDVDSAHSPGLNYAIPPANPLVGHGGRGEIWLYGLRNPFRFSFDTVTGDLWIGDVGQSSFEEIDHLTSTQGGANLGWNIMEGTHCFLPTTGCSMAGLTLPVFDYDHSQGDDTVIGGHIYRGTKMPSLVGAYVFGDFISGRMWTLTQSGSTFTRTSLFTVAANDVSAIGEDQLGELYVARYSAGAVSRIHQVGQP